MLKEIPIPEMKYSDEKADRRLALKVLLVVAASFFVMGFGCRWALACGSYEECMKDIRNQELGVGIDFVSTNGANAWSSENQFKLLILEKAIAYKLEEISKKLDKETK